MASRNTTSTAITIGVLGMSVVVAATVVWVVYEVVGAYQTQVSMTDGLYREKTVEVLAATRTLGAGTTLRAEDLEVIEIGVSYVPLAVVTRKEEVVGRVTRERVLAGEMIRRERLSKPDAGTGIEAIVPEGMRALGLNLQDGDQVSGFIDPGNYVDLLATLEPGEERDAETITLLQAVRVIAVDEVISETATGEEVATPQITILVSPELAERTTHALSEAQPKLTLRTDIDMHHRETHGTMSDDLLGTGQTRMTVYRFHEVFDQEAVWRMMDIVSGSKKTREAIQIDPTDLTLTGFDIDVQQGR